MTDLHFITGCCGAIQAGIVHAGKVTGCLMGSAAGEKSALCAGRSVPASWVRIEAGNGRIEGRTRFVICYHLAVSLGEKSLAAGFRWFLSWLAAGPAAVGQVSRFNFERGGGGRALGASDPSQYISSQRKFSHCPPNYE